MAYFLDDEKIRKNLSKAFKDATFKLGGQDVIVNKSKLKIEGITSIERPNITHNVVGKIKVSVVKNDGEYEDLYSYNTKIGVNEKDEIENCGTIYLTKI